MNTHYTYLREIKPEFITVTVRRGELDLSIRDEDYNYTHLFIAGDDIASIARALADIKVKAEPEKVNA